MKSLQHTHKAFAFVAGILALGATLLSSCSHIDDDERLIYVKPQEAKRAVLIEDFTGQKCVNCPNATNVIHELQETYGSQNVIAVAIHCGPFGLASGLMTDLGKTYWSNWFSDTQGQPVVKINRGSGNDEMSTWNTLVASELAKPTDVSLALNNTYNADSREVSIQVYALGKASEKQKLQLWIVEDSIVAAQKMPNGSTDKQYVHNHILRDAVNGEWGESITFSEHTLEVQRTYTLNEAWKAENCSIVAFTYDDNGVSQATIQKVK